MQKSKLNIIPKPVYVNNTSGSFKIDSIKEILYTPKDKQIERIAFQLRQIIGEELAIVPYVIGSELSGRIILRINNEASTLGKEGYRIIIESDRLIIEAQESAGIYYGVQTLRQLMPPDVSDNQNNLIIPCMEIEDFPRYAWRGMMLDVSRHFFSKEYLKQYIDYLAMYKINVFHIHLTDDQGWRIEIKKYPKLTQIGAWRAERSFDIPWWEMEPQGENEKATYGGFYTQEDIKEIVEYANERFISILPEIDIPGHSRAALSAYPEYFCTRERLPVATGGIAKDNAFCPGKEETFEFLENVLSEAAALFPGKYFHIGGDECNKENWMTCPDCQKRIETEDLQDVHELQSYFIKRIEKILNTKGKRLIGWDEILEGGLAPNATVMSWRGMHGGITAAKAGHDVVMAPNTHTYFDLYQGDPRYEPVAYSRLLLSTVYQFDPVPNELNPNQADHILGGHACLWTETVFNGTMAEYMTFPRLFALSEVLWSPKKVQDWNDFTDRMEKHFDRLDKMDINYATSAYNVQIISDIDKNEKRLYVTLKTEVNNQEIHFTLDGSDPTMESDLYQNPIQLETSTVVKAATFRSGKLFSKIVSDSIYIHKAAAAPVSLKYKYNEKYSGGGEFGLTNCLRGTTDYIDGAWQGYEQEDFEAVVDLGKPIAIKEIRVGFLQSIAQWIFLPLYVEFEVSLDGRDWNTVTQIENDISQEKHGAIIKDFVSLLSDIRARYVRVKARNVGICPDWHQGAGGKAWLFVDEIIVE